MLIPYISSIYHGLIARTNKNYLPAGITKQYLGLPPVIADRVISLINNDGGERISQDQFVGFFVQFCMGTKL